MWDLYRAVYPYPKVSADDFKHHICDRSRPVNTHDRSQTRSRIPNYIYEYVMFRNRYGTGSLTMGGAPTKIASRGLAATQ